MKSLVDSVKHMAHKCRMQGNSIDFLDHSMQNPLCQKLIKDMDSINLSQLGVTGTNQSDDPYHFKGQLNRVTISGNEDYRLVLFFIKKGTVMPLHDHPNMSVYFKLMFGKLNYVQYDKVENKYKYNRFSDDEYQELLETKTEIHAKKSEAKMVEGGKIMLVRPSCGNMHKFVAEEDSCFFDICLPNYTNDSLRRITYFNEVEVLGCDKHDDCDTIIQYNTTPPVLPIGFDIHELDFQGEMKEQATFH